MYPRLVTTATLLGLAILFSASASAQTPGDLERTAAYVAAFQNPDGGFAGKVGQASSLGSTSSAIRNGATNSLANGPAVAKAPGGHARRAAAT